MKQEVQSAKAGILVLQGEEDVKMNLDAFENGVRALVRTGRHGRTAIDWDTPCEATLYLQKDRQGRCCVLALQDRDDFAEFDPRHGSEGAGLYQTEDYVLEVLKIPLPE